MLLDEEKTAGRGVTHGWLLLRLFSKVDSGTVFHHCKYSK